MTLSRRAWKEWKRISALPCAVAVQPLKADVQVVAGAASAGADTANDGSCLYRHPLFSVDLTEMTIKTLYGTVVEDDIVAVTGVAVHRFYHDSWQH